MQEKQKSTPWTAAIVLFIVVAITALEWYIKGSIYG